MLLKDIYIVILLEILEYKIRIYTFTIVIDIPNAYQPKYYYIYEDIFFYI